MPRLLICGDVLGQFDALFKRVNTLHKSKAGPFDMLLVSGAFFADDGSATDAAAVAAALAQSPIKVYFTDPRGAPQGLLDVPPDAGSDSAAAGDAGAATSTAAGAAPGTAAAPSTSSSSSAVASALLAAEEASLDPAAKALMQGPFPRPLPGAPDCAWLGPGGVVTLGRLTVAFLSPGVAEEPALAKLQQLCGKALYMGADLLLTPEWPQGTGATLDPQDPSPSALAALGVHLDGVGSSSAAAAAVASRPRYHFAAAENAFWQRVPYWCRPVAGSAIAANRQATLTRFIGLGTIPAPGSESSTTDKAAAKARKWLHAIAIEPLAFMAPSELNQAPEGVAVTPSPFELQASSDGTAKAAAGAAALRAGDDNHLTVMRQLAAENAASIAGDDGTGRADTGVYFFGAEKRGGGGKGGKGIRGGGKGKRGRGDDDDDDGDDGDDGNNATLYLGGFPPGSAANGALEHALQQQVPGIAAVMVSVRAPPGKGFAFVEFTNNAAAKEALYALDGVPLLGGFAQPKWGKSKAPADARGSNMGDNNNNQQNHGIYGPGGSIMGGGGLDLNAMQNLQAKHREAEQAEYAADLTNKTLFVSGYELPLSEASAGEGAEAATGDSALESALRHALAAAVPELAAELLMEDDNDGDNNGAGNEMTGDASRGEGVVSSSSSSSSGRVSMRIPPGKNYAFLEFGSHEAATSALAFLSHVQHVPPLLENEQEGKEAGTAGAENSGTSGNVRRMQFHARWGKPRDPPKDMAREAKRPRFEPDSRTDCWFCLASPTCEAHLVTSVSEHAYMCMPKGSLGRGHVLLLPIAHLGSAHAFTVNPGVRVDLATYKQALAKCFFETENGSGMVVFERFADTRGTYHNHTQIVPLPATLAPAARRAFERCGQRAGLNLMELPNGQGAGPDGGAGGPLPAEVGGDFYFSVELWLPSPPQGPPGATGSGRKPAAVPSVRLLHRCPPPPDGGDGGGANSFSGKGSGKGGKGGKGGGKGGGFGGGGGGRVPVQFGREVLAELMGMPERGHWKACVQTQEEEEAATEAFKTAFGPYDPTLQ